ncbi:MAG: hypothetical protein DLM69_11045 [Candidatus Chloroheliales bacterium]|nr:MAG: hypothetical protein DLM69_11045 [Chloroflexota bacterium]
MDDDNEQGGQELDAAQREQVRQRAAQQLQIGQSLIGGGDAVAALSALTEAAYLFIGLRDEAAGEALNSLVGYIQDMGEEPFDTASQQMDEQHRAMLDQLVALLQQMEENEDEGPETAADLSPEVKAELLARGGQQLAEGREAASNGENGAALNSLVEAAAIYIALDDEHKEEALAAFVSLLQGLQPDDLNHLASQLDEQHQRWMMGIMSLLQQRTIEEHGPEIREAARNSLAQAQATEQAGDNSKALGLYAEAFSNAASLQDGELANQVLTSFGAMADRIGPGELAQAHEGLDERGKVAFQMLLSALAELRDPAKM